MAATIKPIDNDSVHHLHAGQVVLELQQAIKELVENSLDAGATSIDVRIKDNGLDTIEISDNGSGISEPDWPSIGLKHHTSKLPALSHLPHVTTFGFRGEALSALCALCESVTITTSTSETAPKGAVIRLGRDGRVEDDTARVARPRGTTMTLTGLFAPLPVRRKEFERTAKREFSKALNLLYAYALVPASVSVKDGRTGVRLKVESVAAGKAGKRTTLLSTDGRGSLRSSINAIWGPKALDGILDIHLDLDVPVDAVMARREGVTTKTQRVIVTGLVSTAAWGQGRTSPDRQFFYINTRPCDLKQVSKVINEVYKSFNSQQIPLAILDFHIPPESVDINVSPDKRTIFLHSEANFLVALREGLEGFYLPNRGSYAVETGGQGRSRMTQSVLPGAEVLATGSKEEDHEEDEDEDEDEEEEEDELESEEGGDQFVREDQPVGGDQSVGEDKVEAPPMPKARRVQSMDSDHLDEMDLDELPSRRESTRNQTSRQASTNMSPPRTKARTTPYTTPRSSSSRTSTSASTSTSKADLLKRGILPSTTYRHVLPSSSPASVPMPTRRTQQTLSTKTASWSFDRGDGDGKGGQLKSGKEARVSLKERLKGFASQSGVGERRGESDESEGGDGEEDELEEEEEVVFVDRPAHTDQDEDEAMLESGEQDAEGVTDDNIVSHNGHVQLVSDGDDDFSEPNDVQISQRNGTHDDPLPISPPASQAHVYTRKRSVLEEEAEAGPSRPRRPRSPISENEVESPTTDTESSVDRAHRFQSHMDQPSGTGSWRDEFPNTSTGSMTMSFNLPRLKQRYLSRTRSTHTHSQTHHTSSASFSSSRTNAYEKLGEGSISSAAGILNRNASSAEEALNRVICKADFGKMEVLGQFNKGFIITRLRDVGGGTGIGTGKGKGKDDLFIVDQHAGDEKYNFETLQRITEIKAQGLIRPRPLQLTASDELVAIENLPILRLNGFDLLVDEEALPGRGERVKLTAMPISKDTVFDFKDLEQLLHLLSDSARPQGQMVRCTKARAMFASRACRKSVMIGKALTKGQMAQLLRSMGTIDQPWNCPHGRPTMRHLIKIEDRKMGGMRRIDWASWKRQQ